MIRLRRLLFVAAALFTLGAVVTTGAFTGGDEAVRGVYLTPAETENGQQYASLEDGQLELSMTNLSPSATTVADDVFLIGTDFEQAQVWIEDGQPAVSFYRMDTGTSIEQSDDPIQLTDDDPVTVGVRVESGTEEVILDTISIRAQIPEDGTETATDTDTETATDTGIETATDTGTETATDTDTETPTDTGTDTATDTGTETPTSPDTQTDVGGGANPVANVEVVDLTTDPAAPSVGEAVTITGTYENVGENEATVTLQLRADGEVISEEAVTLAPGEQRTITGTVSFDEPGAYEIALLDRSITVTVEEQSPLEIGGFAPLLLAALVLLGAAALLLAYWRSSEQQLIVRLGDESWATLELLAEAPEAVTETDSEGRTILRFDLAGADGDAVTFDPAFSIDNTGSEAVGVRIVAVDDEGRSITDGVTIEGLDGTDLSSFSAETDAGNVLADGETLAVQMTIETADDVAENVATLQVEASNDHA